MNYIGFLKVNNAIAVCMCICKMNDFRRIAIQVNCHLVAKGEYRQAVIRDIFIN